MWHPLLGYHPHNSNKNNNIIINSNYCNYKYLRSRINNYENIYNNNNYYYNNSNNNNYNNINCKTTYNIKTCNILQSHNHLQHNRQTFYIHLLQPHNPNSSIFQPLNLVMKQKLYV